MKKLVPLILVVVLLSASSVVSAQGPVVHHVHVGGPDACSGDGLKPGCDGNFSLVAHEYADGSVQGEYTDRFSRGDGFHAVIDCLYVDGNQAWVSGVITNGSVTHPETGEVFDMAGLFVAARVVDNGSSAKEPPDRISLTQVDVFAFNCNEAADYELFDLPEGQVKVR